MKPVYAQDVVVAIKDKGILEWYVLNTDLCFMDYGKLVMAERKRGIYAEANAASRFDIMVVNESSKDEFLDKIKEFKVSTAELKEMLLQEKTFNDRLAYNPAIYIDFDSSRLISYYPEPESFENYVPDGWTGEYFCFDDMIPKEKRYWEDEDGKSLIGGIEDEREYYNNYGGRI